MKQLANNKNINYYDDFIIVNEEIYNYYFFSPNIKIGKQYIINSGKIIIIFKEREIYQALIGKLYLNYINLKFLINFKDVSEINELEKNLSKKNLDDLEETQDKDKIYLYEFPKNDLRKIETLALIYLNLERINYRMSKSKFKDKLKFYIASKEWIKYLNTFYNYNNIIEKLKSNDEFVSSSEKFNNKNTSKLKKEFLENLIKQIFQNEYLEKINKNNLYSNNNFEINSNIEKLRKNNSSETLFYYNDFLIINKKIKKILNNIYQIDSDEQFFTEINCLTFKENIYIFYQLNEKYIIAIGKFRKELTFNTDIIIEILKKELYENNLIEEAIKNKIQTSIQNLTKSASKDFIDIQNQNNEKIGIAYKVPKIEKIIPKKLSNNENVEEIKVKEDILNMIKMCLFNIDFNNKIYFSNLGTKNEENNNEKYIYNDKCFLINKECIDSYKNTYKYDNLEKKLHEYIEKNDEIKQDSKGNLYSIENINIIYKFLQKNNELEKYKTFNSCSIEKKIIEIKKIKLDKEENIDYYDDFIIVNEDIYKSFSSSFNIIHNNNNIQYIINSGKIIIFFEETNNYQALVGEMINDCIDLNLLINFKNISELNKFKNNLLNEKYGIIIEQLKKIEEKEKVSLFELPNEKYNKIKSLGLIYINLEILNLKIKESKIEFEQEFFIVNKKWKEYLNKFYNYDKIITKIKENINFPKLFDKKLKKELKEIKKPETQNNTKKINKMKNRLLHKIIKEIYQNEDLENIFNKDSTSQNFDLEINLQNQKFNNVEISFYNDFLIIDDKIKASFNKINKKDSEIKYFFPMKCFIYQNNIHIIYPLNGIYLINIGNFNADLFFNSNIIIEVKDKEFQKNNLLEDMIKNDIQNTIKDFISKTSEMYINIKNNTGKEIGTAYKVLINEENKENQILKDKRNLRHKRTNRHIDDNLSFNIKKRDEIDEMKFDENNIGNKMIKLFILLYINYKEIGKNIKKEIKKNRKTQYYLINKEFMKIYKNYYEFDKIENIFKHGKSKNNFDENYDNIVKLMKNGYNIDKCIFEVIKNIPRDFLFSLENKKIKQDELIKNFKERDINNTSYSIETLNFKLDKNEKLNYIGENEMISSEFLDLFDKLETNEIKSILKQKERMQLLLGENKIYIISEKDEYFLMNIGYYENKIFKPYLLIYYKDKPKFNSFISSLESYSFKNIFKKYEDNKNQILDFEDYFSSQIVGKIIQLSQNKKEEKAKNDNKNDRYKFLFDEKKQEDEDLTINSESMKLIKLIIYLQKFTIEANTSIKNKNETIGYPVEKEFLQKIKNLKSYRIIENYINNTNEIKKIFSKFKEMDKKEEDFLFNNIIKCFDKAIIKEINKNKEPMNIYSNDYNAKKETLDLNRGKYIYIYIMNNFILLNEEIYNLFKSSRPRDIPKDKISYIIGDNKTFILIEEYFSKNSILVFNNNLNNKYELELELILYFDNNNVKLGLDQIKQAGYKKLFNYLLFDTDLVSPIFDKDYKIIGTAYKYDQKIKDYTNYNINFEIKKMFLLYTNYQMINHKLNSKNNSLSEYYIINKDYLQDYKNYYNFEKFSAELDKNPLVKNVFQNVNSNERLGNIINDKKLTLMIKSLPKDIIENFNKKDKYFKNDFKTTKKRIPDIQGFEYLDKNNKNNGISSLFYSYNFELISSEIYESLFRYLDTNVNFYTDREIRTLLINERNNADEGKVECRFEGKTIIIKFLKRLVDAGNKYIIYIGELKSSYIFEPNWFFLYENSQNLEYHSNYVISMGGFNSFCNQINNQDSLELIYNNKICGIALKKVINNKPIIIEQRDGQDISGNNNINNGDNNIYKDYESILYHFYEAPKIGLANIGATCYMNATLQCFCQIEEFASFFKYDNYVNTIKNQYLVESKDCLTASFKTLIEELWPNNPTRKKYYEPWEFRNKIAKMNPLFKKVEANDAKDLVNFIIMTLHEELNKSLFNYAYGNNNMLNVNNNNPVDVFNMFYQDYLRSFRSKISEIFYAIQETQTKCLNCQNIQYNYQAYFFLVFPLEEVRKYAIQNIMNNNSSLNNNNLINNMNNMNNMGIVPFNNNNVNINNNFNFNINFNNNNNNFQRNNSDNLINNNNVILNNFYFMDAFNNQINMNNIIMNNNNGMNMQNINNNNNIQGFNNFGMNNNFNNNMNVNSMPNMNNNFGMNNNFNTNMNLNSMPMPNMQNNFGMNNNFNNNMNFMNNMNNFNGNNLSNIAFNNMFNMGMNNNNMSNFNMNSISNNNGNISNPKLQNLYNNKVDITDCFEYNKKVEFFTGSNQIYCNNCKNMANANYVSYLVNTPKVLILLLNRGAGIQFKVKLEFPMEINMSQYINLSNGNIIYKLIGVITHLGLSGQDGHFIAHCLSPIDNNWYTYNDAGVSLIKDIKRDVIDIGMPYLLFYQRKS